ncbi:hypothetical protein J6590_052368 [Homalodisca vitripennis]|nr:hypothetical protein J6590_052368 [Homalodisca vitripennis]
MFNVQSEHQSKMSVGTSTRPRSKLLHAPCVERPLKPELSRKKTHTLYSPTQPLCNNSGGAWSGRRINEWKGKREMCWRSRRHKGSPARGTTRQMASHMNCKSRSVSSKPGNFPYSEQLHSYWVVNKQEFAEVASGTTLLPGVRCSESQSCRGFERVKLA